MRNKTKLLLFPLLVLSLLGLSTMIFFSFFSQRVPSWVFDDHVIFEGSIENVRLTTSTLNGLSSDRINLLIESPDTQRLHDCFSKADWVQASPLAPISLFTEVWSILFSRSDPSAPVSSLYLFGRVQDRAYEISSEAGPRSRHHVRLWLSPIKTKNHQIWAVAATFDTNVDWLKLTHLTDQKIDGERNYLIETLKKAGCVVRERIINSQDPAAETRIETDNKVFVLTLSR